MKYVYLLTVAIVISGAFLFASNGEKTRRPLYELAAELKAQEELRKSQSPVAALAPIATRTPATDPSAPPPKCLADETQYEFGIMAIEGELEHEFLVRNDGGSPLRLTKGKTSCKCTIADLSDTEILPGKTAPVRLTWRPRKRDDNFRQTATIHTNDPERASIEFVVHGRVEPRVVVEPGWMWSAGDVRADEAVHVKGLVYSAVQSDFQLLEFQTRPSASKLVFSPMQRVEQQRLRQEPSKKELAARLEGPPAKATFVPLSREKLQEIGAKSGYELDVEISPGTGRGPFREDLELRTNLKGDEWLTCMVVGRRIGAYSVLPSPGATWSDSQNSVEIERFEASKGKTVELSFVMFDADASKIEMTDVQCTPSAIRCNWRLDPKSTTARRPRYRLTVEIPPGQPRMTFNREKPATIRISTNHAALANLEFKVLFSSY